MTKHTGVQIELRSEAADRKQAGARKRVVAIVGSPRRKSTHRAVRQLFDNLEALGGVECELVALSDYQLEPCSGCTSCFLRGEERCPRKDDRDALLAKLDAADGVIFATPNYAFQVSAQMKTFLDRLAFVLHRPRFFGKTFTSVVVQAVYGGEQIVRYLELVAAGQGFNTVEGSCLTLLEPMTAAERKKLDRALATLARRFHRRMMGPALATPSWFRLWVFRGSRTWMQAELDAECRDHQHYLAQGWFESDYYYPVRLGLLKRVGGRLFDRLALRAVRRRRAELVASGALPVRAAAGGAR